MASEQDAARDRVLAARTAFDAELQVLEASGRSAVDIPARIRQSPGKAAAVIGAIAFLLLRGPQRLWSAVRRAVFGAPAPMPKAMLPKEIEKTLRSLGSDGDKVRGVIERDFAAYAKKTQRDRRRLVSVLALGIARPILTRGARAAAEFMFSPTPEGYATRLDQVRARAGAKVDDVRGSVERSSDAATERAERAGDAAKEQAERAAQAAREAERARDAAKQQVEQGRGSGPRDTEDASPTGV